MKEVCRFSEVVEKLAQDEDPHPARSKYGSPRGSDGAERDSLQQPTFSHTLKHKYVVRSRHKSLANDRFVPSNRYEAARNVLRKKNYDDADFIPSTELDDHRNTVKSVHGASIFKRSSPISQDIYRAHPQSTLDSNTSF